MLPEPQNCPEDVSLLAKSFSKCLVERGFTRKDLLKAAEILLDQALQMPVTKEEPRRTPLRVIARAD